MVSEMGCGGRDSWIRGDYVPGNREKKCREENGKVKGKMLVLRRTVGF